MTVSHKNRVQMSVSGTPGTGTITLGSAASGYQSFSAAHGANATVDVLITDGTAWEVARACTYTHSSTTLSRGTLEASSTGSAISLTSAAVVSQIATADFGDRLERTMQAVMPGGRLTLASGCPVPINDVTGATSVLYTPYRHDTIPLWDGSRWVPVTFAETTLALGTLTSGLEYSVYGYASSGALVLESAAWPSATVTFTNSTDVVNWTSTPAVNGDMFVFTGGTANPTGLSKYTTYFVINKATNSFQLANTPGGSAVTFTSDGTGTFTGRLVNVSLQDGRWCKNGDKTRLYLGAFYTTATTTTEDSITKRYLSNVYNQLPRTLWQSTNGGSYSGSQRDYNNNTSTELAWLDALPNDTLWTLSQRINGSGSNGGLVQLLFDGFSGTAPLYNYLSGTQECTGAITHRYRSCPIRHYVRSRQETSGTVTFSENVSTAEILG